MSPVESGAVMLSSGSYLVLSGNQLLLGSGLFLFSLLLSLLLRLQLIRTMGIAAVRMVVQLLLVGLVLDWIFSRQDPGIILLMAILMASVAAASAARRPKRRFPGIYWNCLVSILASSFLVTGLALTGIFHLETWFNPQYLIPLLGMVLGNTLNGISLALDRFLEDLQKQKDLVETRLCLGASAWEASHDLLRNALRTGLIPSINSMAVMGVVSLPGMMTGQILAGVSPGEAVRYQIVIAFMITTAATLGSVLVLMFSFRILFSSKHQLLLSRLKSKES